MVLLPTLLQLRNWATKHGQWSPLCSKVTGTKSHHHHHHHHRIKDVSPSAVLDLIKARVNALKIRTQIQSYYAKIRTQIQSSCVYHRDGDGRSNTQSGLWCPPSSISSSSYEFQHSRVKRLASFKSCTWFHWPDGLPYQHPTAVDTLLNFVKYLPMNLPLRGYGLVYDWMWIDLRDLPSRLVVL